ncbi:MAG TPA: hypothetical protein VES39_03915 [Rhodospirillales bacterium]|nr:hypothetical protein [Rhodospirillales bacterium]
MSTSDRCKPADAHPHPTGWLTPCEQGRASRFRACVAAGRLPSDVIPAPAPRGSRWGQGPMVESPLLQLGAAPRQQRRRQPR